MGSRKSVLTTGEVARICNVAPRTVSKWFDSGQLRGYRIPGSKDRRIPVPQLVSFMHAHGIPTNGLDSEGTRILMIEPDQEFCVSLQQGLSAAGVFHVTHANECFEAGALAIENHPHVMVVSAELPVLSLRAICRHVRSRGELQNMRLIAMGRNLAGGRGVSLMQEGFDAWIEKPFEISALLKAMGSDTSVRSAALQH